MEARMTVARSQHPGVSSRTVGGSLAVALLVGAGAGYLAASLTV